MAKFDIEKMTLGEIAKIEELSGLAMDQLDGKNTPKGKMLAALLFVHRRRQALAAGNPPNSVTWAAIQDVPFDEASRELGFDDDDEPTPGQDGEPAERPTKPATRKGTKKS